MRPDLGQPADIEVAVGRGAAAPGRRLRSSPPAVCGCPSGHGPIAPAHQQGLAFGEPVQRVQRWLTQRVDAREQSGGHDFQRDQQNCPGPEMPRSPSTITRRISADRSAPAAPGRLPARRRATVCGWRLRCAPPAPICRSGPCPGPAKATVTSSHRKQHRSDDQRRRRYHFTENATKDRPQTLLHSPNPNDNIDAADGGAFGWFGKRGERHEVSGNVFVDGRCLRRKKW